MHPIGNVIEQANSLPGGSDAHGSAPADAGFPGNLGLGFFLRQLAQELRGDFVNIRKRVFQTVLRYDDLCHGIAGYGVVLLAAPHINQAIGHQLEQLMQKRTHELVGVGAALVNFSAAVAASQAVHVNMNALSLSLFDFDGKMQAGGRAACAAHRQDALRLGVAVDQYPAVNQLRIQRGCAVHADLFIHGKKTFQRRMGNIVSLQDRQSIGYGNPVVAAQGRPVSPDVFSVGPEIQAVGQEINFAVLGFLCNHIHMALQNHNRMMLIAGGSVFVDHDVIDFVLRIPQSVRLGKVHQIVADLLCIFGPMRDLADLFKIIQRPFGLHAV